MRRCTRGTLLNGQTYEDAWLHVGDRLRIGPVELEVVECQAGSAEESLAEMPADAADSSSHHAKTQELEACLAAANDEMARLEADAQQAWQTSIVASERSEQLRTAFEQVNVEAGEVRGELEAAQAALQRQREELTPQLTALRQQLEAATLGLAAAQASSLQQQRTFEEHAQQFAHEREKFRRQISQLEAEIERQASQSQAQVSQMTISMDQIRAGTQAAAGEAWEARFQEADRQVEHWQAEAHRRQLELEELQQQLAAAQSRQAEADEVSRLQLESERHEAEKLRTALDERRQLLDAEERELQYERDRLVREQAARESERAAQQAALGDKAALLDRQSQSLRQQLEQAAAARQADLDRQSQSLQQQLEQAAARHAELDRQAQNLQQQVEQTAARQSELDLARNQMEQALTLCDARQQQLATLEAELVAGREALFAQQFAQQEALNQEAAAPANPQSSESDPDAMPAQDAPVAGDPHDSNVMDSVLSGLVQAGLWRNDASDSPVADDECVAMDQALGGDEVAPLSDANEPPELDAEVEPAADPQLAVSSESEPEFPRSSPSRPAPANHDEESIETYMERLMQRVRGDAEDAPRPLAKAPVFQPPEPEQPAAELDPAVGMEAAVAMVKPEDYVPRSQAPELSRDMAAMRELANSAARSAIDHHRYTHGKKAAVRLLTASGVFVGSLLLAFWAWHLTSIAAATAAIIGLAVSGFLILRGFGRLLNSLTLARPRAEPAAEVLAAEGPHAEALPEEGPAAEPVQSAQDQPVA